MLNIYETKIFGLWCFSLLGTSNVQTQSYSNTWFAITNFFIVTQEIFSPNVFQRFISLLGEILGDKLSSLSAYYYLTLIFIDQNK